MENKLCTSKRQKLSRIIELHKELENSNTSETEKLKKISLDLKLNLDEFKKFLAFFETQYNNLQKQLKKKEKQILALQPNVVGEVTAFHEKIAFMLEKQFNEDLKASRFLFYSLNLRMKAVLAVAEGKATAEEFAHANIGKPIKSDNELQKDAMFIEDNIPAEAPVARKNFWEKVIEKFYIIVSKFSG